MEEQNENEAFEVSGHHIDSQTCECAECQNKRKYIQIIDVDNYIETLNDWD